MTQRIRHLDPEVLAHQQHQANIVMAAVSLEFGLTEVNLTHPVKHSPHLRFARQVAMYLTHIIYELNHTHIARIFSKDRSTVSHACKVVEDSRDDQTFDLKLIKLENFLRQAPRPLSMKRLAA